MDWKKHKVLISGSVLVAGLAILWWLYQREQANAASLVPAVGVSPAGGIYYPATTAADPQAGTVVNLSFQNPNNYFSNQATGYVPLFGFIGVGRSWG